MKPIGPFDSEADARASAHAIVPPAPDRVILTAGQNVQVLTRACVAAGVELGDYDRRIIVWLAGFGDTYCAVFAGLVTRAHEAGKEEGQA